MTLDEEIRLAKEEKELNKKVNALMESLEISDDEGALLRLKYCETAEILREFDYKKNIFESYKESKNYKKINELNETVNLAKEKIYSTNINIVTEGYRELAKVYLGLSEAGPGIFAAMENKTGRETEDYIQREKAKYKRLGRTDKEAEEIAVSRYERDTEALSRLPRKQKG